MGGGLEKTLEAPYTTKVDNLEPITTLVEQPCIARVARCPDLIVYS